MMKGNGNAVKVVTRSCIKEGDSSVVQQFPACKGPSI